MCSLTTRDTSLSTPQGPAVENCMSALWDLKVNISFKMSVVYETVNNPISSDEIEAVDSQCCFE